MRPNPKSKTPLTPSRRLAVAPAALAGCALAISTFSPAAQAKPPCPPELVAVDLGNHQLSFADNGDGTFEGTGVAGTLRLDDQGLTVLANGTGGLANAMDLRLRFPGANLRPLAVEGTAATHIERFTLGQNKGKSLASFSAIESLDAYPGVDLQVTASQRRVWITLEAESAAALGAVRLAAPGAALGSSATDRLTLSADTLPSSTGAPSAGPRRTLEMELVALDADSDRRLPASLNVGKESASIRLHETPKGAVKVLLTSLIAPYTEATDVESMDDGRVLTVIPSRAEPGSDRQVAVIHELDAGGKRLLSSTTVAGSNGLSISGLSEDRHGRLLMVGRQSGREVSSPVAVSLDLKRGVLAESRALAQLGSVTVDDAVIGNDGRLVLVGSSVTPVKGPSTDVGDLTLNLPVTDERRQTPRFVATVDLERDTVVGLIPFAAAKSLKRLWVWVDCWGQVHIGLPWTTAMMTVDHTYSITIPSSDFLNCPRIDESHGFGALCWKARKSATDWTYHPFNVNAADVPSALVFLQDPTDPSSTGTPDHTRLNQLENNQFGNLYFNTVDGQWADPGGGWGGPDNWAYSKVELAIAAAIYQERWTSPIFANLRVPTDIDPAGVRAVMLREETFRAASSSQLPHNICDDDIDGNGESDFAQTAYPAPPEYQVANACASAHSSSFSLQEIKYDTWRVGSAYIPDQTLSGSSNAWWPFFSPYVGDPPVEDGQPGMRDVHLKEMSRRLAGQAQVPTLVQVTTFTNGSATSNLQQGMVGARHMQ